MQWQESWFQLKQITSVYVTGLPPDATETEVAQHFSKCGVIKLDEEQRPRVKIYRRVLLLNLHRSHSLIVNNRCVNKMGFLPALLLSVARQCPSCSRDILHAAAEMC